MLTFNTRVRNITAVGENDAIERDDNGDSSVLNAEGDITYGKLLRDDGDSRTPSLAPAGLC